MKNAILLFLLIFILASSCSEDDNAPIEVTYEVITENGAFWTGEFVNENGERITTISLDGFFTETEGHRMPSGWKYTFNPKVQPIELLIAASSECRQCLNNNPEAGRPSITSNIYINNKLVWTETDNCRECTAENLKGLATSWFKFPEEWK